LQTLVKQGTSDWVRNGRLLPIGSDARLVSNAPRRG
jgi:hypothetical protein